MQSCLGNANFFAHEHVEPGDVAVECLLFWFCFLFLLGATIYFLCTCVGMCVNV